MVPVWCPWTRECCASYCHICNYYVLINLCSDVMAMTMPRAKWCGIFNGTGLVSSNIHFQFEANIHHAISLVVNIFIPIEACNLQISLTSAVS